MQIDWGTDEDHTTDGSLEIVLVVPRDGKGKLKIRAADRATEIKMVPLGVLLSRLVTMALDTAVNYAEALKLMREHLEKAEAGQPDETPETDEPGEEGSDGD